MPDGLGGPEIPGLPPEEIGARREEAALSEEVRLRRLRETLYVAEIIRDPDVSPDVAREFLIHEVLFPSEEGGIEMSRWEVNPTLREILRRTGENEEIRRFAQILEKQDAKLNEVSTQIDGLRKEAGREDELENLEQQADYLRRTKERTKGIIEMRMRASLFPEESKDWFRLYQEIDAAVSWHEIYLQRERAQTDVDTYADSLFKSNFFIATAGTSSLIALLEQEEYGPALEQALRAYVDLHLTGKIEEKETRRLLQEKDCPPDEERKLVYEAVRKAVGGDPFVAKRAEVLARNLFESTLFSVWLAVPRTEKGEVDYEKVGKSGLPEIGFGRLEGSSPTDLPKLVLFRLKYWPELNKNYPSFAGGMARWVPESLTPTLFHFMQTKDKKSVFDEWYFGKEPLVKLLREVPEDAFSSWVYCIWRQNNVRNHLLNFSRGGEKDCITEMVITPRMRAMKKDFDIGISDPFLRLTSKVNMVGCRIGAWLISGRAGIDRELTATNLDSNPFKGIIRDACIASGFLTEAQWGLVDRVVSSRTALTLEEVIKSYPNLAQEIYPGEEKSRLEAISRRELTGFLKETKESDDLVREIAAGIQALGEKPKPEEVKRIIAEKTRVE